MRADAPAATGASRARSSSVTVPIMAVALVAAGWTVVAAQGMWTVSGTMGQGLAGFLVMWAVMMSAMMLPSMAPVASRYLRSRPWQSGVLFVSGYVLLWAGSGVVAWSLGLVADQVVGYGGLAPQLFASGVFAAGAVFYLTPVKYRLLGACRSPMGLLVQYAARRGRLRDLRAGLHHGVTCLGCCWSLMALMVVFGMMNVPAMVVIGVVVAVEKLWARGVVFARAVGVASAVAAVAVLLVPNLAVGLAGAEMSM